jgi:hypothetical protein
LVWLEFFLCLKVEVRVAYTWGEGIRPMKKLNPEGCRRVLEAKREEFQSGYD